MESTTLRTERLLLRKIEQNDVQNVFKGLSHPGVIKYYGVSFSTLAATEEQMIWYKELEQNETGIWWAICSPNGQTFYGAGGFNNLDKKTSESGNRFLATPRILGAGFYAGSVSVNLQVRFRNPRVK